MAENRLVVNQLFTEQMRPKTLDKVITFERVKAELYNGIQANYLFCGTQGIGKTSICRVLCQGYETLTINCSLDRGIDAIRESIVTFCSSVSLLDDDSSSKKKKVVLLEEFDNLTKDSYLSLRSLIEKYASNVYFLANCNYVESIPAPILSRFTAFYMDPQDDNEKAQLTAMFKERTERTLTALRIGYTDETVTRFLNRFFPDFRSVIKTIQSMYSRGCAEIPADIADDGSDLSSLFAIILGQPNPMENYKQLQLEWSLKPEMAVLELGKQFPNYLNEHAPQLIGKLPTVIITIAEHGAMLSQCADHFVVFLSLVYKLQIILHS